MPFFWIGVRISLFQKHVYPKVNRRLVGLYPESLTCRMGLWLHSGIR